MNSNRSNRRNATPAAQDAPNTDAPAQPDTDAEQQQPTVTTEQDTTAPEPTEPDSTDDTDTDAPAPEVTDTEPDTEDETAPGDETPITDAPVAEETEPAPAPAPAPERTIRQELERTVDPTVPVFDLLDEDGNVLVPGKVTAFSNAAIGMTRQFLTAAVSQENIACEIMQSLVPGQQGRSVQPGNAIAQLTQAIGGSAVHDCVTHDKSAKKPGRVYSILPTEFKASWTALIQFLQFAPNGPIVAAENQALASVAEHVKLHGLTDAQGLPTTEYQLKNKGSRAAMQRVANEISARVHAALSSDPAFARVQASSAALYNASFAGSKLNRFPVLAPGMTPAPPAPAQGVTRTPVQAAPDISGLQAAFATLGI
jgi:hypothetical protein